MRCSFPNLWRILMVSPLDPEATHSPPSHGLKGNPNGAKKALAEIGRSYNVSGRTMSRGSRDEQTTPFRGHSRLARFYNN